MKPRVCNLLPRRALIATLEPPYPPLEPIYRYRYLFASLEPTRRGLATGTYCYWELLPLEPIRLTLPLEPIRLTLLLEPIRLTLPLEPIRLTVPLEPTFTCPTSVLFCDYL
jgi:hypothetical protein